MAAGYQADPRWQAAHAEWMRETGSDETASDAFLRRVRAVTEMHAVESRTEATS